MVLLCNPQQGDKSEFEGHAADGETSTDFRTSITTVASDFGDIQEGGNKKAKSSLHR